MVNKMKIKNIEIKAKDAIIKSFQDIPFVRINSVEVEPDFRNINPDIDIRLQSADKDLFLIAEIKNNGEPRCARQAVSEILSYIKNTGSDYGIFIAPYISSKAAAICQAAGVGYIDLAGNCYISFERIYIHKEGKPNPFKRKRYLRTLFSPKAERILRVLITAGPKEWKVKELAVEADVSLGQVSNVKKLLADQEWIDEKTVGFSLNDPLSLIGEWLENYQFQRNDVLYFYTMSGISEFEFKLGEFCKRENIRYALTGFSGSTRYAPAVRYQRAAAYVEQDFEKMIESIDIKAVDSGANVLLLKPYDEGVFYGKQEQNGSIIVSAVQNYLDLSSFRGRGQEAAEKLLEKAVLKKW